MISLKKLFTCLLLSVPAFAWAQFPLFSQTMANPTYYNPAFTGIQQNLRTGLHYARINGGETVCTSAFGDIGLPKINSGIGLMYMNTSDLFNEKYFNTSTISASYAYAIKIAHDAFLRLGVNGQAGEQPGRLNGMELYKLYTFLPDGVVLNASVGGGALLYTSNFYLGVAEYNITSTKPANPNFRPFRATATRVDIQTGGFIKCDEFTINPNFLVVAEGHELKILPGINISNGLFTAGASASNQNGGIDATFMLGITKGKFKFCGSYTHIILGPGTDNGIGFDTQELSLIFQLGKPYDTSDKPMIANMRNAF